MTIIFPKDRNEVYQRMATDFQAIMPEANPFLRNSFLRSLLVANAGRNYDFYTQLKLALQEIFPDTATGEFLERWGYYIGVTRNPATQASGNILVEGNAGVTIPAGTIFNSSNNFAYEVQEGGLITDQILAVTSITRNGNVATATFASNHNLASGITMIFGGATQPEYNVTAEVTVVAANQVTFPVAGAPATPATGTIQGTFTAAEIPVKSALFGSITNQDPGSTLTILVPISGAATEGYTKFDGIDGGTDEEADEDYAVRVRERYANPVAHFNVAEITAVAKEVSGVTRVFVLPITPNVGDVTVYFLRDNDANIIPTGGEIAKVKQEIVNRIMPVNTDEADVHVLAPTPVTITFDFDTITPDTAGLRAAITNNLQLFFKENVTLGEDVKQVAFNSIIYNSIDLETGTRLQDFTLNTPTADVTIAAGEIGVLGGVTF